jgi:hypothetical protein
LADSSKTELSAYIVDENYDILIINANAPESANQTIVSENGEDTGFIKDHNSPILELPNGTKYEITYTESGKTLYKVYTTEQTQLDQDAFIKFLNTYLPSLGKEACIYYSFKGASPQIKNILPKYLRYLNLKNV